jgi:hypothetical protein
VLIKSESDKSIKYESGSQTFKLYFFSTYQTMIGNVSLTSISNNCPFEKFCFIFTPILFSISFSANCLRSHFHVKLISLFICDNLNINFFFQINWFSFLNKSLALFLLSKVILHLRCFLLYTNKSKNIMIQFES